MRADAVNGIITKNRHLLDSFISLTKETGLEFEVKGWIVSVKFILDDTCTYCTTVSG